MNKLISIAALTGAINCIDKSYWDASDYYDYSIDPVTNTITLTPKTESHEGTVIYLHGGGGSSHWSYENEL
jgi:hypothetical protein